MAGVVLVTEFKTPQQVQTANNSFSGFVDYINREASHDTNNVNTGDYLDYMDNKEKSDNLFTAFNNEVTPEQKKILKDTFNSAQKKGSLLWQTVLSFDNDFLAEHGLYDPQTKKLDKTKIMEYTRGCMKNMLEKENLNDSSIWTAAIHYNTDNIHVHVATVEPLPQRERSERNYIVLSKEFLDAYKIKVPQNEQQQENIFSDKADKEIKNLYFSCKKHLSNIKLANTIFVQEDGTVKIAVSKDNSEPAPIGTKFVKQLEPKGKFKQSSINNGKSYVVNQILKSKEINEKINNVIRKKIIDVKKENPINKDPELAKLFLEIHSKLPADKRMWRYNMNEIKDIRPLIDKLSYEYISKYHPQEYIELEKLLDIQEKNYREAFGKSSTNNLKDNKLKDLYERLGNTILKELREYDKEINKRTNSPSEAKSRTSTDTNNKYVPKRNIFDLNYSMSRLKQLLKKDFKHAKNQYAYDEIQREISSQNNTDYDFD